MKNLGLGRLNLKQRKAGHHLTNCPRSVEIKNKGDNMKNLGLGLLTLISLLACDTGGMIPSKKGPPWEKLYIKLEISGVVRNEGDNAYSRLSYKVNGWWQQSISYVTLIRNDDTYRVYGSREMVITWPGVVDPPTLVGVKAHNSPDIRNRRTRGGEMDDYLLATIYVKSEETGPYKILVQNKDGDPRKYDRYSRISVVAETNLRYYRP